MTHSPYFCLKYTRASRFDGQKPDITIFTVLKTIHRVMGLFSFFKKAGSKALVQEEKKAASSNFAQEIAKKAKVSAMRNIVSSLEIDVRDLEVDLDDDVVVVSGVVGSHADREKVILALGNVHGIATVDDRIEVEVVEEEVAEVFAESQFYTVQKGDSLSKIAKKFYGNAMKYPVIFEANKPMLKDPSLIYPGQNLRIPSEVA